MNHDEASRLMGAYLDGELDLTTCLALEEHLAGCPICQETLIGEKEMIELVQSETPRFEASPFLKTRIRAALREESSSSRLPFWKSIAARWIFSGIAIAAVILLVSVFSLPRHIPELVQEAVADHIRSLQASHLMDVASTDQHTVKPWFNGKLDYSPPVVDLTASGYPLIGGRLDVLAHRDVAAIIYQRRKHYINLFIWPSDTEAPPRNIHVENGYRVLGWTKAGMNFLAVSDLGEKEFRDFVKMIQDQTVETRPGE
jgi:anti-sigma factor RsiW